MNDIKDSFDSWNKKKQYIQENLEELNIIFDCISNLFLDKKRNPTVMVGNLGDFENRNLL